MTVLLGLAALALVAGAVFPVQVGSNGALAQASGSVLWASWVSTSVSSLSLLALYLVLRLPWPKLTAVGAAPVWAWTGGLYGAYIMTVVVFVGPKIGVLSLFSLVVAGQMLGSLVLDHFGAMGLPVTPISAGRIIGALLLITGVVLVQRF